MRVAILTFINRYNFGAELQAYALSTAIKKLGHEVEILDIYSVGYKTGEKPIKYGPLQEMMDQYSVFQRIKVIVYNLYNSLLGSRNCRKTIKSFEKFKSLRMPLSLKKFNSVDEFYDKYLEYDAYIVGSDQVWNPTTPYTSPEPYFLTFAEKDSRRISYAASFGVEMIPKEMRGKYSEWIGNINSISVRESQGQRIVKDLVERESTLVLDPTLLLTESEWREIAEDQQTNNYILMYDRIYNRLNFELADMLRKRTGYNVVRIPRGNVRDEYSFNVKYAFGIGPTEFLGLYKDAKFVITSSFHGTAFAVNFKKRFLTVLRPGGKVNGRMIDLLERVGLSDCIVYTNDSQEKIRTKIDAMMEQDIRIGEISELRSDSINWLAGCLE